MTPIQVLSLTFLNINNNKFKQEIACDSIIHFKCFDKSSFAWYDFILIEFILICLNCLKTIERIKILFKIWETIISWYMVYLNWFFVDLFSLFENHRNNEGIIWILSENYLTIKTIYELANQGLKLILFYNLLNETGFIDTKSIKDYQNPRKNSEWP